MHTPDRCVINQREIGALPPSRLRFGRPSGDPDVILVEARPRDGVAGADRSRDRPPRLWHPAHQLRAGDHRPRGRCLPPRAAGPGADHALDVAAGGDHPAAAQEGVGPGAGRCPGDHAGQQRHPEPHPREQALPDQEHHAGRAGRRHADHGAGPQGPRSKARITREQAIHAAQNRTSSTTSSPRSPGR